MTTIEHIRQLVLGAGTAGIPLRDVAQLVGRAHSTCQAYLVELHAEGAIEPSQRAGRHLRWGPPGTATAHEQRRASDPKQYRHTVRIRIKRDSVPLVAPLDRRPERRVCSVWDYAKGMA